MYLHDPHSFPFPDIAGSRHVHLRLLATSDLHVHIMPFDYYSDRRNGTFGLARAADLIAALRRGATNTVLFDNGDFLQGSPLGDRVAAGGLAEADVHPVVAGMNALRYDAGNIGNHEFSHGLPLFLKAARDLTFPLVSANTLTTEGKPLTRPWVVLDRMVRDIGGHQRRLRLGVIGFLPAMTEVWDREHLSGRVRTTEVAPAADRHLPELLAGGADLVIALFHGGIGGRESPGPRDADAASLAARPEIDALVAGHTHLVFPGPSHAGMPGVDALAGALHGKPAVMPGAHGSHVGVIDLLLSPEADGRWRVLSARSAAFPVATIGVAVRPSSVGRRVRTAARAAHSATRASLREPLGQTDRQIDTHFAHAGNGLAAHMIAEAKRAHVHALLAGTNLRHLPVLATASAFKAGGRGGPANFVSIPAGPIMMRHVASLYPFPNTICALRMTAARLADWLERAASIFHQIRPGIPDQTLVDPGVPGYRFFCVHGIDYVIDPSVPARSGANGYAVDASFRRVRDLRLDGAPLHPESEVVVATSSYRAGLFLSEEGETAGAALPLAGSASCRDILARWIREAGVPSHPGAPGWRLRLPPGTSVLLETSPAARPEAAAIAGLNAEAAGLNAGGFLRVRLTSTD